MRGPKHTNEEIVAEIQRRIKKEPDLLCGTMFRAMHVEGISFNWGRFKPLYKQVTGVDGLGRGVKISEPLLPTPPKKDDPKRPWRPTEVQRAVLSLLQQGLSLHHIKNGTEDIVWVAQDFKHYLKLQDRLHVTGATLDSLIERKLVQVTHRFDNPTGAAYGLSDLGAEVAAKHPGNLDPYRSEQQIEEIRAKEAAAKKAADEAAKQKKAKRTAKEEAK